MAGTRWDLLVGLVAWADWVHPAAQHNTDPGSQQLAAVWITDALMHDSVPIRIATGPPWSRRPSSLVD